MVAWLLLMCGLLEGIKTKYQQIVASQYLGFFVFPSFQIDAGAHCVATEEQMLIALHSLHCLQGGI